MPDMIRTVMVEQKMMYEEQIAQLRAERDEARRMLCLEWTEHSPCFEWMEDRPVRLSKEQIAMRYGWDCFSNKKAEADENNTLFRTTDGE